MKLDRNVHGRQKYALIKLREFEPQRDDTGRLVSPQQVPLAAIDFGDNPDSEFFVIKLKDKHAFPALTAYAGSAMCDDPEYAQDVLELMVKAHQHPGKKQPD